LTYSSKLGITTFRFFKSDEELDSSPAAPKRVAKEKSIKKLEKAKNQK
jgi:hypothetical protein